MVSPLRKRRKKQKGTPEAGRIQRRINALRKREDEFEEMQKKFFKMFPRYDLANRKFVRDESLGDEENEMRRKIFETRTQEIEMMAARIDAIMKEEKKLF